MFQIEFPSISQHLKHLNCGVYSLIHCGLHKLYEAGIQFAFNAAMPRALFLLLFIGIIIAPTSGAQEFHLDLENEIAPLQTRELGLELQTLHRQDLGLSNSDFAIDDNKTSTSVENDDLLLKSDTRAKSSDFYTKLEEDLAQERLWNSQMTRLQHHIAREEGRLREGGLVGDSERGVLLFDVLAIARHFKDWMKRIKAARQPEGAKIALDGVMTISVKDYEGHVPSEITVTPLIRGYVGDATHALCDPGGLCTIRGWPQEPCPTIVQAAGVAAFAPAAGGDAISAVVLHPPGRLTLHTDDPDTRLKVRIVHIKSTESVPISQWLNPQRGEWFVAPTHAATLELPQGEYEIQWTNANGNLFSESVKIDADRDVNLKINASP